MAAQDFQWFLQHADAYESLTAEQLHVLGNGGTVEWDGDTAATPVAASDATPPTAAAAAPAPASEPVTTPTADELATAQARIKELDELTLAQGDLIKNLQIAKAADAAAGADVTAAQEDLLAEFRKDFPEIAEKLAPALQKIIDAGVAVKTADIEKRLTAALVPLQQSAQDVQTDAHFQAITEAIPDFETIRDSGEVEKWLKTQPSYVQKEAERIMFGIKDVPNSAGTASEVIELFTQYKSSLGKPAPEPVLTKEQLQAKAAEAVAKAQGRKTVSSTDVPSGGVKIADEEPTTTQGWSQKFAGMSPEQIMKEMNK